MSTSLGWEGNRRHWPCVTDNSGLSTYWLYDPRKRNEYPAHSPSGVCSSFSFAVNACWYVCVRIKKVQQWYGGGRMRELTCLTSATRLPVMYGDHRPSENVVTGAASARASAAGDRHLSAPASSSPADVIPCHPVPFELRMTGPVTVPEVDQTRAVSSYGGPSCDNNILEGLSSFYDYRKRFNSSHL